MAESLLMVRDFVSGIYKLNLKNLKPIFFKPRFLPSLLTPQ